MLAACLLTCAVLSCTAALVGCTPAKRLVDRSLASPGTSLGEGANGCSSPGLSPGSHLFNMSFGGDPDRPYIIHIPAGYNASAPTPLVMAAHGLGENYPQNFQEEIPRWDALADSGTVTPFVSVYPLGSKSVSTALFGHTWNAGECCFSKADDEAYLRLVLQQARSAVCVDAARTYFMGFSAGGMMANRMACAAADVFAAVVSVSGPLETNPCNASRAVPYLHFHGKLDPVCPFNGDPATNSVPFTIAHWQERDSCGNYTVTYNDHRVEGRTYHNCTAGAELQLAVIDLGGHAWPPADIKPEEWIWQFLSRHTLSQS